MFSQRTNAVLMVFALRALGTFAISAYNDVPPPKDEDLPNTIPGKGFVCWVEEPAGNSFERINFVDADLGNAGNMTLLAGFASKVTDDGFWHNPITSLRRIGPDAARDGKAHIDFTGEADDQVYHSNGTMKIGGTWGIEFQGQERDAVIFDDDLETVSSQQLTTKY